MNGGINKSNAIRIAIDSVLLVAVAGAWIHQVIEIAVLDEQVHQVQQQLTDLNVPGLRGQLATIEAELAQTSLEAIQIERRLDSIDNKLISK